MSLSPLMAAIMDASEARPVTTIDDETCLRHFGCIRADLPRKMPRTVVVRAGGRAGKTSRILATKSLHAAWTVPLPHLQRGEVASALLIAPDLRMARQALSFCTGYVQGCPEMSASLVKEPTKDEIVMCRPDGKLVSVQVAAATRGGKGGRSKTLVFAALDEACFFRDEATGVINDTEIYRAILQRIVPGGQCWIVSTPWAAGLGLLESLLGENFGTHEHALCAIAPTRALNPFWDPTGEIERDLREQDPDAADREILAIPLTAGSSHFLSHEAIRACAKEDALQRRPWRRECVYGVGGDLAFRRNSSALAIVEREGEMYRLAYLEEQKPTSQTPLVPEAVVGSFAAVALEYRKSYIVVDSHERDAVALELAKHKCSAHDAPNKEAAYVLFRKILHQGRFEMPVNPRLTRQLKDIVAKPTPGGGLTISSPKKTDGSHGDLVSAIVNAVHDAERGSNKPGGVSSVGTQKRVSW